MGMMTMYKPGQGRQARGLALILFVLAAAWGCYSFFEYANSKLDRLVGLSEPYFGRPFAPFRGGTAMTQWLTPGFVLALAVFLAVMWWGRRLLNRPRVADHLIGTELEMRRVKWPTRPEVVRAGSMVVYYVFWLALIIFVIDLIMASIVGVVLQQDFQNVGIGRLIRGIVGYFGGGSAAK